MCFQGVFMRIATKKAAPVLINFRHTRDLLDRRPVPDSYLREKCKDSWNDRPGLVNKPYDRLLLEEMLPRFIKDFKQEITNEHQIGSEHKTCRLEVVFKIFDRFLEMKRLQRQDLLSISATSRIRGGLANELLLLGFSNEDLTDILDKIRNPRDEASNFCIDEEENTFIVELVSCAITKANERVRMKNLEGSKSYRSSDPIEVSRQNRNSFCSLDHQYRPSDTTIIHISGGPI